MFGQELVNEPQPVWTRWTSPGIKLRSSEQVNGGLFMFWTAPPLKKRPIDYSQTWVTSHQSPLGNVPQERRSNRSLIPTLTELFGSPTVM